MLSLLSKMGNRKNKWKFVNCKLCELVKWSKWLSNVRSSKRSPCAKFIGEDGLDKTSNSEVKEKDLEVVTSKEQRREHKQKYQWKYRLQQTRLLVEEKSQQII